MRSPRLIRVLIAFGLVCAPLTAAHRSMFVSAEAGASVEELEPATGAHDSVEEAVAGEDGAHPAATPADTVAREEGASAAAAPPAQSSGNPAPDGAAITVGGRALTGPYSSPQRRGERLFLPVFGVASALGDLLTVDHSQRLIEVRRQTGVVAEFDAQSNQVRENGAVVLVISDTGGIDFPPRAEELMLPVEIVAALLDVSIHLDAASRAVRITRGPVKAETVRGGEERASVELYRTEYDYSLSQSRHGFSQNLSLRSSGRAGDGRFDLVTNFGGGSGSRFGVPRNATLAYERPNGQRFIAGDFGSGADIPFMSAALRGVSASILSGGVRVTSFAGRAASGSGAGFLALPDQQRRRGPRYDTNVFGAYTTFDLSAPAGPRPGVLALSTGAMYFRGPERGGGMLSGSLRYASGLSRFQGEVAAGNFSGSRRDGSRADGLALALDLSASHSLGGELAVQGRYRFVGANFLGPQSGSQAPTNLAAGGLTWRPARWITASLNGSASSRPELPDRSARSASAAFNITPGRGWPTVFISHSQSSTPEVRGGAFTLLNAAKDFSRWQLFVNATRIKTLGPAALSAQLGGNIRINETNLLQLSQSFGSGGSYAGAADWRASSLLDDSLSLGAGFGYARSLTSPLTFNTRLFAAVRLPRQSTLQFNFVQGQTGPQFYMSLRGSLGSRRGAGLAAGPAAEAGAYRAFYGRVYQDVNLDGRYDAGVDTPQANARVGLDGGRYVETDAGGRYRVEGVKAGEHVVQLDLLSVRADLTLLDGERQTAMLLAGRDSIVDFRLVRTGRVAGTVWFDRDGNGRMEEGEQPLRGVRVMAANGKDTLTDADGTFVIGDLPPGEHVVLVDEKTLPEGTKSAAGALTVRVSGGGETGGVNFSITLRPAVTKKFP